MTRPNQIRPSKELVEIINYIRAKYLLERKKPPSITKITKMIANNIDKEKIWNEIFIRF